MSRSRHVLIILGVLAVLLLSFGTAAAKDNDKPKPPHGDTGQPLGGKGKPARLVWTPRRITQAVTAGQTIQVTATLSSSVDIAEATLVIPGGLGKVLKADTAKLTTIKAGTPTPVTFTITMPATGAHTQGGVVLVRTGRRMVAMPLSVLLTVPGTTDQDDEPKSPKPPKTHPNRP
jgi:hypothetical protein